MTDGWGDSDDLPTRLQPWEEIIGRVQFVEERDGQLAVGLSTGTVAFPFRSAEAAIVREELEDSRGDTVSILRTGLDDVPLVVSREP